MLKKFGKLKSRHKIIFAVLIGIAVIMFWRGIWGLLDMYLFPDDQTLSFLSSSVIGLVLLLLTRAGIEKLT